MNCPSEARLIAAAMLELSPSDALEIAQHVSACSDCSRLLRTHSQLIAELGAREPYPTSDADFVANVMAKCDVSKAVTSPARPRQRRLMYALAAILAGCVLWLSKPLVHSNLDVITARGSSSHALEPVTADVLLLRGNALSPIERAQLHPGDGIAVRYWNASNQPFYLAVFALDAQKTVHWVYPAYLDASQNPKSILLERSVEGRILGEVVEPDRPANGALNVVALVTTEPLSVRDIEAKVSHDPRKISEVFPRARVQEWSCTWNAP